MIDLLAVILTNSSSSGTVKYANYAIASHKYSDTLFSYTTKDFAFSNGLAYVQDDGIVIMKGDNTTQLASGVNRNRYVAQL